MPDFTTIARKLLLPKAEAMDSWIGNISQVQLNVLDHILAMGAKTDFGRSHGLTVSTDYTGFRRKVKVSHYEDIRPWVERMLKGEKDVLWPGRVKNFAQSSGTSDGSSKYIPITAEGLKRNHVAGASAAVACYLRNYPDSRIFSGKSFILGGNFSNTVSFELPKDVKVGDLSATLISSMPKVVETFFRIPKKRIALMEAWEKKLPALVKAASDKNVTNISGVPSWFMAVLNGVLDHTGKKSVKEVWPNLEVFFHGGISFEPYREQYRLLMGEPDIRYVENYNASEGFFAIQDLASDNALRLLLDHGVFFEFLEPGKEEPVPAWDVEAGKVYEMLITSVNGLWRYSPGDTVRVERCDPIRIRVAGRTKHFINAFGEEVMVYNAEVAVKKACELTGAAIENYTVAPLYAEGHKKGHHQWLVEFSKEPENMEVFTKALDSALRRENSDYDAKRSHSLFLEQAEIVKARKGVFDRWLALTGKIGGQRKVPRLANDRKIMDLLLNLNNNP